MSATEFITRSGSLVKSYRLVILYGLLFSLNSLASCVILAFAKVQFKDLQAEDWLIIICSITMNWTGSILALLNKAFAKTNPP